ncbi:MAG: hypothetical protein ACTS5P_00915 [Candidatus Hodgkinia cicadicola]
MKFSEVSPAEQTEEFLKFVKVRRLRTNETFGMRVRGVKVKVNDLIDLSERGPDGILLRRAIRPRITNLRRWS